MSDKATIYEVNIDQAGLEVREKCKNYAIDLNERLMRFAVEVMRFLNTLPNNKEFDVFRYQLSRSATSVGANYNESQAGSYAEFRQRIQICLREARESHYFLKVIARLKLRDDHAFTTALDRLLQEAHELTLIFGAISAKTNNKRKTK